MRHQKEKVLGDEGKNLDGAEASSSELLAAHIRELVEPVSGMSIFLLSGSNSFERSLEVHQATFVLFGVGQVGFVELHNVVIELEVAAPRKKKGSRKKKKKQRITCCVDSIFSTFL